MATVVARCPRSRHLPFIFRRRRGEVGSDDEGRMLLGDGGGSVAEDWRKEGGLIRFMLFACVF